MPNLLIYDPNSKPVANRVTRFIASVPEYEFERYAHGLPYLVQPDLPIGGAETWKVDKLKVVPMTAQELQTLDAFNLDARRASRWFGKSPTHKLQTRIEPLL